MIYYSKNAIISEKNSFLTLTGPGVRIFLRVKGFKQVTYNNNFIKIKINEIATGRHSYLYFSKPYLYFKSVVLA